VEVSEIQTLEARLDQVMVRERARLHAVLARLRRGERPTAAQAARLEHDLSASAKLLAARREALPRWNYPPDLPISGRAEEIVAALRAHPVVVVAGETGSGKTTQLPKMCLEAGFGVGGKIACTQPRRVAALSVSRRIAEELGVPWGREVGAKIRFTDRTGPETLIKMMTDGMLLAEVQADPELWEYDAIVVDEAHERSLNIDFLLGYLQLLRARRPELRVVITSATIDTAAFSKAFADAPIITVSGRTYPVEVRYEPIDARAEEAGDFTFLDGVVAAVREVLRENRPGDLLVFLPGEKDIRELRALLEGGRLGRTEILPLFGRLSNAEQQRIFAPTQARKIILATNIAETSLTIPGIRYVIDTGLARVSRYHARTHTRRLPIEPIAQSSADQRAGRAGRMEAGVCIRLYEEKDYAARPRYATPELLRSNLAEVILRMIAFGLGEVESFPFLDPPKPAAVKAGYELLQDLGALDPERRLTPLGAELAHLPCDPTVGRMLLQAREEGALREVLAIASGLSIQDPRERPADAREAADRMHQRFVHPESDFLTLLNIWDAYHDQMESLTQNQLRRFCREHFLSYLRMREWRDVHAQLSQVMRELEVPPQGQLPAEYEQIHRSILSGLLAQVAHREAGNHYRATHQRAVMLFPGSALFDKAAAKAERKKFKGKQKAAPVSGNRTAPWIVCAEWMETSRLFARTVARIEPAWIEKIGAHLLTVSHVEPSWDERGERAVVRERRFLYGLEIGSRRIGYDRLDPEAARRIFIQAGIIGDGLRTILPWLERNRRVREEVEEQQTRLRQSGLWQLDERLERFYEERLPLVSSVRDLEKWWRRADEAARERLELRPEDLLPSAADDPEAFPEALELPGVTLPLRYVYKPGEAEDGATLRVPFSAVAQLDPAVLDWAVPGYVKERIQHLLKGLPKDLRRQLHPLGERAEVLATLVKRGAGPLEAQLTGLIAERFGVQLWPGAWDGEAVPAHLRPRVEVFDAGEAVIAEGRDWEAVRAALAALEGGAESGPPDRQRARQRLWDAASVRFERPAITAWLGPDLPPRIELGRVAEVPVWAYPGLLAGAEGRVDLKLFPEAASAAAATAEGFPALLEHCLSKDLGWAGRELVKELKRVKLALIGFIPWPAAERGALAHLRAHALAGDPPTTLGAGPLEAAATLARERLRGYVPRFVDELERLLALRRRLRGEPDPHGILRATLERLLPIGFLAETPPDAFWQLGRYLEAALRRAAKAVRDPGRDRERVREVDGYTRALAALSAASPVREELRWALEEYRVSLFAQELGTRRKVSPAILDGLLAAARGLPPSAETRPPPGVSTSPKPSLAPPPPPPRDQARPPERKDLEALKRLLER
jgi:ATP-dependent helicase HrpA